ncbi:hypothetical protein L218DRAFT_1009554 [Marasmius fiardii PR-910]|nr:hypothetical protein L218DRAFT_1009554 [Marasmius fiardii PR-910]
MWVTGLVAVAMSITLTVQDVVLPIPLSVFSDGAALPVVLVFGSQKDIWLVWTGAASGMLGRLTSMVDNLRGNKGS